MSCQRFVFGPLTDSMKRESPPKLRMTMLRVDQGDRRKVDARVIDYKPVEKAAGQAVRQKAVIRQGIDRELAKRLVKEVKDGKFFQGAGDRAGRRSSGSRARSATICSRSSST